MVLQETVNYQVVNLVTNVNPDPSSTTTVSQTARPTLAPLSTARMLMIQKEQRKRSKKLKNKAARKTAPGINTFAMDTATTDVIELYPGKEEHLLYC